MSLRQIKCARCGGELIKNESIYKCSSCNATFIEDYITQNEKIISQFLTELKQEKVAALRQRLWEQTHAKYLSSTEIQNIAKEIRNYLPEDNLAKFYEVACSNNKKEIIEFINNIDYTQNYYNLDLIVEFMLRNLNSENLLSVNNLIEKAFKEKDLKTFSKYSTELSIEAEKIENGVYETTLPRDIFIAYSSKDMKTVEKITSFLESQGLKCFVAMRNLKHGVGAVEDYDKALEEAIDNCKIFLFISSTNSRSLDCDAVKKEIPYVIKDDKRSFPQYKNNYPSMPKKYKKPRIQYLLNMDKGSIGGIKVKEFFDGYDWCQTLEELTLRVSDIIMSTDIDEDDNQIIEQDKKDNSNKSDTNTNEIDELKRQLEEFKRAQEEKKRIEEENKEKERLKQELEALKKAEELERIRKEQELERLKKEQEQKAQKKYKREGDYIYFGSYPQGGNGEIEPIKWRILSEENGEALLLSEYILDAHRFDPSKNNYKNSEIRKWLNNDFYNKAFKEDEKQLILTTNVDNSERSINPNRNANEFYNGKNVFACENTQDKVFLLSMQEVTNTKYGFNADRTNYDDVKQKKPTAYAKKQGVWTVSSNGTGDWWLRSPSCANYRNAWDVDFVGYVSNGSVNSTSCGVASALRIKL